MRGPITATRATAVQGFAARNARVGTLALATLWAGPLSAQAARCEAPDRPTPISAELADSGRMYRGVLAPGGAELLFFKKVSPGGEDYRIFSAQRRAGRWIARGPLVIGQEGVSDLYPTLSPDGRHLVFASYRAIPGAPDIPSNAYLWRASLVAGQWVNPRPLTTLNAPGVYHPGVEFLADGSLRFRRVIPAQGTRQAFLAAPDGAEFASPVDAGEPAHWLGARGGVLYLGATTMSPDGSLAIVGGVVLDPRTGRPGLSNGYLSRRVNGTWTAPVPLGAGVNTAGDENFFTFTSGGCAIVFTRDYTNLYWVSAAAARESPPSPAASRGGAR